MDKLLIDNYKLSTKKRNNNLSYNSSLRSRHSSLSGKNSDPIVGDCSMSPISEKKLPGNADDKKVYYFFI